MPQFGTPSAGTASVMVNVPVPTPVQQAPKPQPAPVAPAPQPAPVLQAPPSPFRMMHKPPAHVILPFAQNQEVPEKMRRQEVPERFAKASTGKAKWLSKAALVIAAKVPAVASPEQIRNTLINAGVKPEEMQWTGIDRFLESAGAKVAKKDLLGAIKANSIKLNEKIYGEPVVKDGGKLTATQSAVDAARQSMMEQELVANKANEKAREAQNRFAQFYKGDSDIGAYRLLEKYAENYAKLYGVPARSKHASFSIGSRGGQQVEDWNTYSKAWHRRYGPARRRNAGIFRDGSDIVVENDSGKEVHREPLADAAKLIGMSPAGTPEYIEAQNAMMQALSERDREHEKLILRKEDFRKASERHRRASSASGPKTQYGEYTKPGGSNYRELIFTLPTRPGHIDHVQEKPVDPSGWKVITEEDNPYTGQRSIRIVDENGSTLSQRSGYRGSDEGAIFDQANWQRKRNREEAKRNAVLGNFQSGHWTPKNVVAHTRFKDRVGPNGEKLLHLEEVQSDWHEAGRDKGYKNTYASFGEIPKNHRLEFRPGSTEGYGSYFMITPSGQPLHLATGEKTDDLLDKAKSEALSLVNSRAMNSTDTVPDAPFKKTWQEMLMRRMLQYAAQHGYQGLTWNTGRHVSDLFNIGNYVDKIIYKPLDSGKIEWNAYRNGAVAANGIHEHSDVAAHLGNGVLNLMKLGHDDGEGAGPWKVIANQNLHVGGEGMKGFYDDILPKYVNRFVKPFGVRVGSTTVDMGEDGQQQVHHVPITEPMKQHLLGGVHMFSRHRFAAVAPPRTVPTAIAGTQLAHVLQQAIVHNDPIAPFAHKILSSPDHAPLQGMGELADFVEETGHPLGKAMDLRWTWRDAEETRQLLNQLPPGSQRVHLALNHPQAQKALLSTGIEPHRIQHLLNGVQSRQMNSGLSADERERHLALLQDMLARHDEVGRPFRGPLHAGYLPRIASPTSAMSAAFNAYAHVKNMYSPAQALSMAKSMREAPLAFHDLFMHPKNGMVAADHSVTPPLEHAGRGIKTEAPRIRRMAAYQGLIKRGGKMRYARHVDIRDFSEGISESPNDDAPKLVVADYLAEHGDPREHIFRAAVDKTRPSPVIHESVVHALGDQSSISVGWPAQNNGYITVGVKGGGKRLALASMKPEEVQQLAQLYQDFNDGKYGVGNSASKSLLSALDRWKRYFGLTGWHAEPRERYRRDEQPHRMGESGWKYMTPHTTRLSRKSNGWVGEKIKKLIGEGKERKQAIAIALSMAGRSNKSKKNARDRIPGGIADKMPVSAFDPEQLAIGQKIEMEHTSDPKIALEIARDHLAEDADYYRKLKAYVERKSRRRYARATVELGNEHESIRGTRLARALKHLISTHDVDDHPIGEAAMSAWAHGPNDANMHALSQSLQQENHPLAYAYNWKEIPRKVELDRKVLAAIKPDIDAYHQRRLATLPEHGGPGLNPRSYNSSLMGQSGWLANAVTANPQHDVAVRLGLEREDMSPEERSRLWQDIRESMLRISEHASDAYDDEYFGKLPQGNEWANGEAINTAHGDTRFGKATRYSRWDESKHPRDHGKFSTKTGGSPAKDVGTERNAEEKKRSMLGRAAGFMKGLASAALKKIEARYGAGTARAVKIALIVGQPIPLPMASVALAAPLVAWAEMRRQIVGAPVKMRRGSLPGGLRRLREIGLDSPITSLGFSSPNQGVMQLPEAMVALGSSKQRRHKQFVSNLMKSIGVKSSSLDAIGDWSLNPQETGAENSVIHLAHSPITPAQARIVAAKIGANANQLAVLTFNPHPQGAHSLFRFFVPHTNIDELRNFLTERTITHRSIVPSKSKPGFTVLVYDNPSLRPAGLPSLRDAIGKATEELRTHVQEIPGEGEFVERDAYPKILAEAGQTGAPGRFSRSEISSHGSYPRYWPDHFSHRASRGFAGIGLLTKLISDFRSGKLRAVAPKPRKNIKWRYDDDDQPSEAESQRRVALSRGGRGSPTRFSRGEGNSRVRDVVASYVNRYANVFGLQPYRDTPRRAIDPELSIRTADAFHAMQHDPYNPRVQAAYQQLIKEVSAQYDHMIASGVHPEPWLKPGQPYRNSGDLFADVRDNNHIWFFPTIYPNEPLSFGSSGDDLSSSVNPLLVETGHKIGNFKMTANDLLRVVHDYFAHCKDGYEFGPVGEYNAWAEHSKTLSPLAMQALTTETHGQNSWVNFGPHLRRRDGSLPKRGDTDYIHPKDRPYADQKSIILPPEATPPHPYSEGDPHRMRRGSPQRFMQIQYPQWHEFWKHPTASDTSHLLWHIAKEEDKYPVSGEVATSILAHGVPHLLPQLGESLKMEGHPFAGHLNWDRAERGLNLDRQVHEWLLANPVLRRASERHFGRGAFHTGGRYARLISMVQTAKLRRDMGAKDYSAADIQASLARIRGDRSLYADWREKSPDDFSYFGFPGETEVAAEEVRPRRDPHRFAASEHQLTHADIHPEFRPTGYANAIGEWMLHGVNTGHADAPFFRHILTNAGHIDKPLDYAPFHAYADHFDETGRHTIGMNWRKVPLGIELDKLIHPQRSRLIAVQGTAPNELGFSMWYDRLPERHINRLVAEAQRKIGPEVTKEDVMKSLRREATTRLLRDRRPNQSLLIKRLQEVFEREGAGHEDRSDIVKAFRYRRGVPNRFASRDQAVRTPEFKAWFGDWEHDPANASKIVDEAGAPKMVFHGAMRADRVGNQFVKSRATSGPMPFFTDNPEIAGSYAMGKQDTSADAPMYEQQFFLKPNDRRRNAVPIDRAWWHIDPAERLKIAMLAPRIGLSDEGEGPVLHSVGHRTGTGGYDQHIKEARGNHLKALVEEWLNSGNLFNEEEKFLDVLKMAGLDRPVEYRDPWAQRSGTVPVFLSIKRPLRTDAIPENVLAALEQQSRRQPAPRRGEGLDIWHKSLRDAREWIRQLKEDLATGKNSHVWTSIPDWVTRVLSRLGYDGIHDTGGKMGGDEHSVYIPFHPTQIKSAIGNRGTFNPQSRRIHLSRRLHMGILRRMAETGTGGEEDFHRAIRESPNDDAIKLVYADWLDERGDSKRAHVIRAAHSGQAASIPQHEYHQLLAENPKDVALHHAYANWLIDNGKPVAASVIKTASVQPETALTSHNSQSRFSVVHYFQGGGSHPGIHAYRGGDTWIMIPHSEGNKDLVWRAQMKASHMRDMVRFLIKEGFRPEDVDRNLGGDAELVRYSRSRPKFILSEKTGLPVHVEYDRISWPKAHPRLLAHLGQFLGRPITIEQLHDLASYGHQADLVVRPESADKIVMTTDGDHSYSDRTLWRDANGTVYLNNNSSGVRPTSPIRGFEMLDRQVKAAHALGIRKIFMGKAAKGGKSDASGYYAWPLYGFNAPLAPEHFDTLPEEIKKQLRGKATFHNLFSIPGGREEWKEYGIPIKGMEFDTHPESRHSKMLQQYIMERAERENQSGEQHANAQRAGLPELFRRAIAGNNRSVTRPVFSNQAGRRLLTSLLAGARKAVVRNGGSGTAASALRGERSGRVRRMAAQDDPGLHRAMSESIRGKESTSDADMVLPMVYADSLTEQGKDAHAEVIRGHVKDKGYPFGWTSTSPFVTSTNPLHNTFSAHQFGGPNETGFRAPHFSFRLEIPDHNNRNRAFLWHHIITGHQAAIAFAERLMREGAIPHQSVGELYPSESWRKLIEDHSPLSEKVKQRFAKYRAPTGGAVSQGTYYVGGRMMPDDGLPGGHPAPPITSVMEPPPPELSPKQKMIEWLKILAAKRKQKM